MFCRSCGDRRAHSRENLHERSCAMGEVGCLLHGAGGPACVCGRFRYPPPGRVFTPTCSRSTNAVIKGHANACSEAASATWLSGTPSNKCPQPFKTHAWALPTTKAIAKGH